MKDILKNLPTKPGIYQFKNAAGEILYVGKANNLKSRVSSYFAKNLSDRPWISVMMPEVADIETIVVTNETEALMLEATLIKQHLPRYNIKLTDDKAYPYIKFIREETVYGRSGKPRQKVTGLGRFTVTRKQINDGAIYFGPYLSARAAYGTLEFLRKLYGIHISARPLHHQQRACLNCQLNGFTCPLNDEIGFEDYQRRNQSALEFLQGKRKNLVGDLEDKMTEASRNQQFELAAKLRDRLQSVNHILSSQKVISTTVDDYDAVAAAVSNTLASVALLKVRDGRLTGQIAFYFETNDGQTPADILRQFFLTIYQNFSYFSPLIITSEKIVDQSSLAELLSNLAGHKVELRVAERGNKRSIIELAKKNAESKLELKLLINDKGNAALIALKELLNLEKLPERIEAVDISNLGTSEPVGAIVCFICGVPDKNEYRRYKIKTVEGQNDFAMIREVVKRRFHDTARPVPDLFMVDGGKEQLKFALQGLQDAPMRPKKIIGLAKKPDRVFLPDRARPIPINRGHKGLLLLARIRDEVHRFVISFHRKRQSKKSLEVNR